ncbi:hypothetical protein [Pannonibacter tanglangensis]|uniref:Uncharacterized protein n=1 Tax=Pannonibacter tanglangensis TaxID=2750084 RepID=A0ABW9ZIH3_9HYPH|nr:hypothetical protein [Pannonibacter sp. XCT-34]NBN63426.1 hypothetical protein [Pannonibacter sp. XCT-34]
MPRNIRNPEEASLRPLGIAIGLGLLLALVISLTGPHGNAIAKGQTKPQPAADVSLDDR